MFLESVTQSMEILVDLFICFSTCLFVLVVVSILGSDSEDMLINVGNAYVQCSRFVNRWMVN